MIKTAKTFKVLTIHDLEQAVSSYFGCSLKVSDLEIKVFNVVVLPNDFKRGSRYTYFEVSVPFLPIICKYLDVPVLMENKVTSFKLSEYRWPDEYSKPSNSDFIDRDDKRLFIDSSKLFAFDTNLFSSYEEVIAIRPCEILTSERIKVF